MDILQVIADELQIKKGQVGCNDSIYRKIPKGSDRLLK